jgi:tRNA-specific 2-thiouridylase
VLYTLTQEELSRILFPLGELKKPEVRALARDAGLKTASKKESQDICFVEKGNYAHFLEERFSPKPGDILDPTGKILGKHMGIHRFTIGQRRGLGLPGPAPLYVLNIDPKNNTITVGGKELLSRKNMLVGRLNFIAIPELIDKIDVSVKIRYRQEAKPATLEPYSNERALVSFLEPVNSITPGQAAVFYQEDIVVGGGTILSDKLE